MLHPTAESTADPSGKPATRSRDKPGPSPAAGHADAGERRVSMRDVAEQAGVSVATVSMVLNHNDRISRATHIKVRRVIDRLGYRPNRLAQSLSGRHTRLLAILLPPLRHVFADAYFGELISGICDRAGRLGHKIILEHAKPEFIRDKRHVELLERRFVDGVLGLGLNDRHTFVKDLTDPGYPFMVVDNYFDDRPMDHVVCDYRAGAEQAMNYLLQLGHRRIGLIHAAPESHTARDVTAAFDEKLAEVDVRLDDTWRVDGQFTEEGGAEAAGTLIERHPELTAIFAGNDKMALGAIHTLTARGYRIPQDISVMGFDDIQHTAFVNPALTTVHLPLYEVGSAACEKLIERIREKRGPVSQTLPTHLVVRDSTAMAKPHAKT